MSIQDNPLRRSQSVSKPEETAPVTKSRSASEPPSPQKSLAQREALFKQKSTTIGVQSDNIISDKTQSELSTAIDQSSDTSLQRRSGNVPLPQLSETGEGGQLKPQPSLIHDAPIDDLAPSDSLKPKEHPNHTLLEKISDPKLPLDQRLQAIASLDKVEDTGIQAMVYEDFVKSNGSLIRQSHAEVLALGQQVQGQVQKLEGFLPKDGPFVEQLGKLGEAEKVWQQKLTALGQALAKGEDVGPLLVELGEARSQIDTQLEALKTVLPVKNRDLVSQDLEKYVALKQDVYQHKLQALQLDMLSQGRPLSDSGRDFVCAGNLKDTHQQAEQLLLIHDLNRMTVTSKTDVDQVVDRIKAVKTWKLDSNEGFEGFYRNILGTQSLKELAHELRGHLLAKLFQAGIGNSDLVVHYVMNNARNMTGVPDLGMLERPEIQTTDIYQKARDSVMRQGLNKLKAHGEALQLQQLLKQGGFEIGVLGDETHPDITSFSKLKEALTDRHVGVSPLIPHQDMQAFIAKLDKEYGLDVSVLKGNDGQQRFNRLLEGLVTGERSKYEALDKEVFVLLTSIDLKNAKLTVPPLAKLFIEIQHSDQKAGLVQALKTGPDLDYAPLLDQRGMPDPKRVEALGAALHSGDRASLDQSPELQTLYDKLESHAQKGVMLQALGQIPVKQSDLHARMLEMTEATALKAFETVLNAGIEHPDFGRYTDFHTQLKDQASRKGYTEGRDNVPEFQKFQGRLDPEFFKKLEAIKALQDPNKQKEAAAQLLTDLRFQRAQSDIQDFFMDYINNDIQEDRRSRDEVNVQFRELRELKRPISQSDLRQLGQLVGNQVEYYSKAIAQLNPQETVTLSELMKSV